MSPLTQTTFTPLPEALCLIVRELNVQNVPATLDVVHRRLGDLFRGVHQPSESLVYEALGGLINEHKLFHTGL